MYYPDPLMSKLKVLDFLGREVKILVKLSTTSR